MELEEKKTKVRLVADDSELIPCEFYALSIKDYNIKIQKCIDLAFFREHKEIIGIIVDKYYIFNIEEPIELYVGNEYICNL